MKITNENADRFLGQEVIMTNGIDEAIKGKLVKLIPGQWPDSKEVVHICIPLRFPYSLNHVSSMGYFLLSID